MNHHMRFSVIIIVHSLLSLLLQITPCHCADPSPLQDYCIADLTSNIYVNGFTCKNPNNVTADDFFYEGFKEVNDTRPFDISGMKATGAHVDAFPAVNTLGICMVQIQLLKGGVVAPHTHPRGTEMLLLMEGKVIAGFISTDNVLFYKTMTPKTVCVIPPGLVHFVYNIGDGEALLYGSYNSQQPATQYIAHSLFNSTPVHVPSPVLMSAFQVNGSIVELIESGLSVFLFQEIMLKFGTSGSIKLS